MSAMAKEDKSASGVVFALPIRTDPFLSNISLISCRLKIWNSQVLVRNESIEDDIILGVMGRDVAP